MNNLAVKIAIYYALFSLAWILGSDQLVAFLFPDRITEVQTYKGWAFVLLTSFLIFFILHRALKKHQQMTQSHVQDAGYYRTMIQRMQDIYFQADADGIFQRVSPSVTETLGYRPEELIGKPISDLYQNPAYREKLNRQIIQAGGKAVTFECPIKHKNGSVVWLSASSFLRFDDRGNPSGMDAIARNITPRKDLEERMRVMSESLNNAQKIARLGNYDWDPLSGTMWWSNELHNMLNTPDIERKNLTHDNFLTYVHEEDREDVSRVMQEARDNGRGFMLEHRIVTHDGQVKNVYQEAKICIGGPKEPVRISAIVQDVSEQVKAQKALQLAQGQAEQYLEIANTMLVTLDTQGDITMINRRGCEIVGYSKQELIGRNWFELFIPMDERNDVRNEFRNAMGIKQKQVDTSYENHIVTRSGQLRLIHWNNAYLKDEEMNAIGVIASGEDITDRRNMEDHLNFLATHDSLTRLANRSQLSMALEKAIALSNRLEIRAAVLFIDLDSFKEINDDLGHPIGD